MKVLWNGNKWYLCHIDKGGLRKTEPNKKVAKTGKMTVVPQGAILKVQIPKITVWASFFLLCKSGQIRHFWAQIFLFRDVLRWRKTLRMFQLSEPFFLQKYMQSALLWRYVECFRGGLVRRSRIPLKQGAFCGKIPAPWIDLLRKPILPG